MAAYYNEIEPYAAQWLRNLIKEGHIADGVVDERSISDVRPDELYEFNQCHFFAGIGVWSRALRQAGWGDDRQVWTGSCPCQPFSQSGKRKGMSDERHLWPHWFHLIQECRPSTVFGEQVASKDGLGWFDLVQADMEGADYALGAFDLCSAGFGAPHIRQRLWFVADTDDTGSQRGIYRRTDTERQDQHGLFGCDSTVDGMAHAQRDEQREGRGARCEGEARHEQGVEPSGCGEVGRVAHADSEQRDEGLQSVSGGFPERIGSDSEFDNGMDDTVSVGRNEGRNGDHEGDVGQQFATDVKDGGGKQTNGFWGDVDWLACRDAKWRPVESGTFPLVNGTTSRVGRLRAYGNAITAQVAQGVIESYMEVR